MNKCEIVRDLLPLYLEEICSVSSKELVEEHLKECQSCRQIYSEMKMEIAVETEVLENEIQEKNLLNKGMIQIVEDAENKYIEKAVKIDRILNFMIFAGLWIFMARMKALILLVPEIIASTFVITLIVGQTAHLRDIKKGEFNNITRSIAIGSIICKIPIVIVGLIGGIAILAYIV